MECLENAPLTNSSNTGGLEGLTKDDNSTTSYPRAVNRLDAHQRHTILLARGMSKTEIARAAKDAAIIRSRRYSIIHRMENQRRQERREKVRHMLSCRRQSHDHVLQHECTHLCRHCAKQSLDDTSKTKMTMYHKKDACPLQKSR